ncbi:MAG: hypothetical protein R8G01_05645 [Ilumatobacteraceae bacterium]|nr:hypothetical protein [Ilumatobacteraceae bacterium]
MIVVLASNEPPRLTDLDRLDRLHAELHGALDAAQLGDLCEPAEDEHVWLDVARARANGVERSSDATFGENFDAMIGYAASKGWLNDAGTHVRAHVEPAD